MSDQNQQANLSTGFSRAHEARVQSTVLDRVYSEAYGDEYPAEIRPNAFYSLTVLRTLLTDLRVGPGQTMIDLGCGHGATSLWIAQQFGANLIGIDLSPGGVALAERRAHELGLSSRARFQAGDITKTDLSDATCDAAVSLDVLVFVPDKPAALKEVARILRPGARFGFTVWEQTGFSARLNTEQFPDYRPLLGAAGFEVERYAEPPHWREQQERVLKLMIAHEKEIVAEMDAATSARILNMARGSLAELPSRRYVLAVAQRR
jgi:cyclopropane fatty-acyl-phospholipid synthase-like methyltransferase